MAEFTHLDLRREREARKMQRWKLADAVGVSEWTVERWEKGEVIPDPDDVGRIEANQHLTKIKNHRTDHKKPPRKANQKHQ